MKALLGVIVRLMGAGRSATDTGDPRQVRLLANRERFPMTLEESLIARELADAEPRAFSDLVAAVSRSLYRDEGQPGGWAADIGVFGSHLFAPEILRALEAGNGRLWTITPSQETSGE